MTLYPPAIGGKVTVTVYKEFSVQIFVGGVTQGLLKTIGTLTLPGYVTGILVTKPFEEL